MSRVGRKTIELPSEVKVTIEKNQVRVQGPRGTLITPVPAPIRIELTDRELQAHRDSDDKPVKALHGLTRSLLANAVKGVTEGFRKDLDLVGIGFRAEVKGKTLNLSLGFAHPVVFPFSEGIEIQVNRDKKPIANHVASIVVTGNDKQQVGQVAAEIRRLRRPDAYKGKGIRYADEVVKLKVGKKGV
ncbi:MAG: 50S ribosomal protein L6 [Acidobacteria bacterium]|nr:50S ribosomal protein L6 [Acidobacteriota bacterium]